MVEPDAAQFFNVTGLRGQHISDVIRQDPGRHMVGVGVKKKGF
jgi:hypothetical protein